MCFVQVYKQAMYQTECMQYTRNTKDKLIFSEKSLSLHSFLLLKSNPNTCKLQNKQSIENNQLKEFLQVIQLFRRPGECRRSSRDGLLSASWLDVLVTQ